MEFRRFGEKQILRLTPQDEIYLIPPKAGWPYFVFDFRRYGEGLRGISKECGRVGRNFAISKVGLGVDGNSAISAARARAEGNLVIFRLGMGLGVISQFPG